MSSLKRLARVLPPIDRLVSQRDRLQSRVDAAKKDTRRARRESRRLAAQLDEATGQNARQSARIAELEGLVGSVPPDPDRRPITYDADGLQVRDKNLLWLSDPRFQRAYQLGATSGHRLAPGGPGADLHIEWRIHVLLWAAQHAAHLDGDFVECGVNTGIFSLAICDYLDFNALDKSFYLFDTFDGIPEAQMSDGEREIRTRQNAEFYEDCFELAQRNFAPYDRAVLVRGRVPESLAEVEIDRVSYLSIDMNIAAPEIAAIEHFWDKLVPGAPVVLDDYAWIGYEEQLHAWDAFAASKGVAIACLPTGQGLILKS